MFNNSTGNLTKAREVAQENANYFGWPYSIYNDTSGNTRVCASHKAPKDVIEKVEPRRGVQ